MPGPKSKTAEWIFANAMHDDSSSCLIWPYGRDSQGYARAKVKGFSSRLAHRVMCNIAHGDPHSSGFVAMHTCGNGHLGCVNPNHLKWGTVRENNAHKCEMGNQPKGEAIGVSRLSDASVAKIKRLIGRGISQRKIAQKFYVSPATIQAISEGRTWVHVPEAMS